MAGWTGWDEHAVWRPAPEESAEKSACPDTRHSSYGFTPINASGVCATFASQPDPRKVQTVTYGTLKSNRRGSTNRAISEYLGRTEGDARMTDGSTLAGSLHASTTKVPVRKARKRAATSTAASKQKRQKSASLIEVPPASKLNARDGHAESQSLKSAEEPSQALVSNRRVDRNDHMTRKSSVRPVHSAATSVDAVQTIGLQTSMSALEQPRERGFVAYQRHESVKPSNNAEFTRPWLNQILSPPHNDVGDAPNGAQVRGSSLLRVPELRTIVEENNAAPSATADPNASENAQQSTAFSLAAPLQDMGTSANQPTAVQILSEDDDCFPSNCDDDDAIKLLEAAENEALSPSFRVDRTCSTPTEPSLLLTTRLTRSSSMVDRLGLSSSGQLQDLSGPDEDFIDLCDSDGERATGLSSNISTPVGSTRGATPPARDRNFNQREVEKDDHYRGAFLSEEDVRLLAELNSARSESRKRILRTVFPSPVLDRSPIFGASSTDVLRTCFRIGEALNAGSQAFRANRPITIELYARVMSSHREEKPNGKQHFVFHDLYHDKPPHLQGSFELWGQSRLWNLDSKPFLAHREGGVMCRIMAKVKRQDNQWRLQIHSIWECDWDDVDYVAGIYTA